MHQRRYVHRSSLAIAVSGAVALSVALPGEAQRFGMVADTRDKTVTVFDAESNEALTTFGLSGSVVGDCLIAPEQQLGFVTTFRNFVYVIDLSGDSPRLADGTNPIRTTNPGEDLALSGDGRYVIVTDGNQNVPISVIDIEARTEISTLHLGIPNSAVDVAPDGSVLVASSGGGVYRLGIDANGQLFDTGESVNFANPNNVAASPAGDLCVAVGRGTLSRVRTIRIDGMERLQTVDLTGFGVSAVFSPSAHRLYVRTTTGVDVFAFDPAAGIVGSTPLFSFAAASASPYFGIDQIAMDPEGAILYVSEGDRVNMYDPENGAFLGSVAGAGLSGATGVDVAQFGEPQIPNEAPVIKFRDPVVFWKRNHTLADASRVIKSIEDPDGDHVFIELSMWSDERETNRHAPDFKDEWYDGGRGLLVRRERRGRGNGRFYILIVTADDGLGGVTKDAAIAAVVPYEDDEASLAQVLIEAEAALADVRAALNLRRSRRHMPDDLYEHGLADESGPKQ